MADVVLMYGQKDLCGRMDDLCKIKKE